MGTVLDRQILAAATTAGWAAENPLPGVWLLAQPDEDGPGDKIPGRQITVIAGSHTRLSPVQTWFMADDDTYVVTDATVGLLQLIIGDDASDASATAEFALAAETRAAAGLPPEAEYNAPGVRGRRPDPRPAGIPA